jgi:pimeloyl-ACP methyl ester carboxylesterase
MVKFLGIVLIVLVAVYGLACLALYLGQRSMIYYPPQQAALAAPVVSTLAVPGAVLKVSERPLDGRKALIYFGGNAEDVTSSLPLLERAFPGRALYLMHYRGYTGSTGSPTERDLVADALQLYEHVAASHPDIVLVGRSLGSGVAVQVASQRPVERLVLVTPYESIAGIAAQQFRAFPVRWLLKDSYESGLYAPKVKAPTLILAAARDEVIPAWSTRQLMSRFAPGIATYRELEGVGHNTIAQSPDYIPSLEWAQ